MPHEQGTCRAQRRTSDANWWTIGVSPQHGQRRRRMLPTAQQRLRRSATMFVTPRQVALVRREFYLYYDI